jgi:hypothetical protein
VDDALAQVGRTDGCGPTRNRRQRARPSTRRATKLVIEARHQRLDWMQSARGEHDSLPHFLFPKQTVSPCCCDSRIAYRLPASAQIRHLLLSVADPPPGHLSPITRAATPMAQHRTIEASSSNQGFLIRSHTGRSTQYNVLHAGDSSDG